MTIKSSIFDVQPGDDRASASDASLQTQISFDLNTPDSAPDEWKRAAARRISMNLRVDDNGNPAGVPDPDGRVWRRDKGAFATGAEYLDFMRGMIRSGDVWNYAATQELKDFEKADDAGRVALSRAALGAAGRIKDSASRALAPEGYGLADTDPRLTGATADVLDANARLRGDEESRRRYNLEQTASSQPFVPRDAQAVKADTDAIDAWRTKRDDSAIVDAYRERIMRENLWHVWLAVSPSLSEKGRAIAVNAFRDRKLSGADIADFQRLPEKDQAVVAKIASMARNPMQGTFFNTLGDAGVGFLNGILQLPVNAGKQIGTLATSIDQAIFGKNAGLIDAEEMNRRARTEQRLMEALDDPAGINPSGAEHGYIARSLIGAVSTLPYMAYASAGGIGVTAVALDFMQRLDDRIAQDGGDVYGHNPSWIAQKAVYGAIYSGIEKVSALPIFKETSDIALKTMFLELATRYGAAAAAEKLALHVGKLTFTETLQEAAQRMIEEHAASVGLNRGPGWQEAVKGGIDEFAETLGTMGLIALTGSARQGIQVRTLRGRQEYADFMVDTMRRETFLLNDNDNLVLSAGTLMNTYKTAWESGGAEALQKRPDLTPDQAALLAHVFEGEAEHKEAAALILGRNIWVSGQSDAEFGNTGSLDEDNIRKLVADSGPDAASLLQTLGFDEAGAFRVANYFTKESEYRRAHGRAFADILASVTRDRDRDEEEALKIAGNIQPLRSLYQRAGTREGAVKAFRELNFTEKQANDMADAFHVEHDLATSPEAAAAFRAFYLDTSEELTASERLQRMTGFESTPAPEHGAGAALLSVRDKDGAVKGNILYLPGQDTAFDPESTYAGEAVEQITKGIITAAEWKALAPEQRREITAERNFKALGGFTVTDPFDPSVSATGAQADILTGRLSLGADTPTATLYHEATHAWLAVMRHAGKITADDIRKLQDKYGTAADDPGWFNEEALADDIREIGAASDFTPEKTLASRFISAVRRFAGSTRQVEAQRKAASGARQALYENIVYGSEFTGVGEFEHSITESKKTETPPTSGASTAVLENKGTEQNSTDDEKKTTKQDNSSVPEKGDEKKNGTKKANGRVDWTAATPQGNLRVGGYWLIAPRDKFISDTDPRYDFSLQGRSRDATSASAEQVAGISAAGEFDPLRLMDAPDTSAGAPIVTPVTIKGETFYMVLSGNGRFRALDAVDADHRGDTYRNPIRLFADDKGIAYAPADMTEAAKPRLVRVLMKRPAGTTLQEIAARSNQNAVLQMTDSEQASSDAELIERDRTAMLFSANKDGLPSKSGSDEFFAWFVRATGDASLVDSKGNPTDIARIRARRAMLALSIGKGRNGKETVMAFTENAEALGLDRQRDALLMSAGTLSALEDSKPDYALSDELSRSSAALIQIAKDRKSGKNITAETYIGQGDMIDPMSDAAAETLKLLDSPRPAESVADAFRRYAELAARIDTETPDMFGEPNTPKNELLKKAINDTAGQNVRYSLSATLDGLNEKIAREMEEVWNKYHNPDGSEKQSWMATPDESDTILTEKQWMMVRTDSFKAWFGDWENDPENSSKAVGENGEPMVFYHGTGPEFWSFDKSKFGSRENMFFFSSNPSIARDYGTRVMQVFLNMRNPYEGGLLSRKDVIARGHDGFIFDKDEPHNEWAVLHPGQIKSSTNNTGGFNSSNDDIRYSLKANVDRLMTMPPVDNIDVNTFQKSDTDLVTQVTQFFAEKHPDGIERENLGHVALTRRGVKSSIAHGIGQRKAAAFAAVPSVVQNGIEIDRQENWKGRGYDSSVIAAPVNIGDVQYIAEIILTADHRTGDWMFYLHEVEEKEKLRSAFKTGMNTGAPRSSRLILAKMLSQVNSAKTISDRLLRRELIDAGIMTDENYAELTTRPRTRAEHTRDGSNELITHRFRILDWIRTHGYNVEENEADGTYTVTADKSDEPSSEAQEPIRYALDMTGKAYDKKDLLVGFMAHAAMTGASFPSKNTIARMAESIGVESFDYESLAASAKRLAAATEDSAIRKAAISNDPNKAAYAIGELSRHAARAYVRSGAKEGERLARDADRIHNLSEAGVRRAMAALTGADIADIETDTDIDIAASILAADPKKFHPRRENEKAQTDEQGLQPLSSSDLSDDATAIDETDEESPELTDKQRADIARKRKEREARVQAYLDAARERGTKNRLWDEKRRAEKEKSAANHEETPPASGNGDGASGLQLESTESIPEFDTLPIDFSDRWEAAALLRVWAFDRFRRDNPNRKGENRNLAKDRVAVEFFRKTAIRQLKDLARKLLEPGAPRETVISLIGDITEHLTANQIERRTAYIFGLINRHAVREERRELVKKFRAEIKRQFIKGEKFEELGVDLGRTLTGAVEEDARYVMRVCELSDRVLDGETSALQKERERLNGIISERENMTAEDGSPLPAGANDIQTRMALRQLALLDKFGGMIDMMPGEILDLSGSALADFAQEAIALRQRWDAYDKLVKSILEPLASAIKRGEKDPQSIETKAGAITDSLTGMLRLRLDFLTRYADPEMREAARTAINDFMDLLARGNTDFTISLQEDEAALNRALGEIFTRQDGSPDRKRIRAYLRRLDQKIPKELALQLSRQGHQNNMTYGQMLNLLGYLDQWASYKNNIIKHERQGQAALIRSFVFENPETGNVDPVLTAEDTQVLEWLRRQFYANKRDKITAVTERLAGRSVDSPDPLYMPATMLQEKRKGLHVGQGAWQPLAGVFSRRVRNNLDVDERASILDVFHDRSRETALLMAFSERGMIIREILTSRSLQDVIKRYHGDASLTRILKQVEQTLNGGRPKTQTDAQANAAALAMRVTTYIGLGWNVQSAAKQTASLPIFANVIGTRKLWQIMLSAPDPESIRKLRESDEYRVRYGTGPASGMDIATRATYDSPNDSAFKRFFADWGLWANRKADWVISAWIGQGIYRDFKAKYLDQGMSEQDAERRAISETFTVIEETQQSGRTENATALTREHGLLGKLLTQFATSPLQQMQYEITSFREWRDLAENNGNPENIREARNRFVRATMINHIIVPGLMTAVTSLYKAVTGGEPDWKKDGFWWTLFIAAIMGQFGRIFFAGALTEQTLRTLLLREPPRMGQLVPAEGAIRFTATLAYPIRDVVTWDEKHFADDIRRVLKSIALTRLPTSMYENYMKDNK